MSVTIVGVFENAKSNLETFDKMTGANNNPLFQLAMNQLDNALKSIDLGKDLDDDFDEEFLSKE